MNKKETVGIEIEFKTTPYGAKIFQQHCSSFPEEKIQNLSCKKFKIGNIEYYFSFDHNSILEFKTKKIPISDFDRENFITLFKNSIMSHMRELNIPFIYYGIHISIFNFSTLNTIKDPKKFIKMGDSYIVQYKKSTEDTYKDPFLSENVLHSVVKFDGNLDERFAIDKDSTLCLGWIIENYGDEIKNILSKGPLPGGSLRVNAVRNRIEFVLGWLDKEDEIRLFNILEKGCKNFNQKERYFAHYPWVGLYSFSPKRRFSLSLINGVFNCPNSKFIDFKAYLNQMYFPNEKHLPESYKIAF